MDARDGFITGIYNYCDRWCERCDFTSYCRLFADCAEIDASLDPALRPVVDAAVLAAEVPPPPPDWLREVIEEFTHVAARTQTLTEMADSAPHMPAAHVAIESRASQYLRDVQAWLRARGVLGEGGTTRGTESVERCGPFAVIDWFGTLLPPKIHRALAGLAAADGVDGSAQDAVGSAKVALLGIDESHAVFLAMIESGRVRRAEVDEFIAHLVWLGEAVEQVFPTARAFVRPGLDEPDALARLRDCT